MSDLHHYGDTFVAGEIAERTTIHGSGTIDIQVDPNSGLVIGVWFRCLELPFTVSAVAAPPTPAPTRDVTITAIDYLESE